jgi:hypothetical protein
VAVVWQQLEMNVYVCGWRIYVAFYIFVFTENVYVQTCSAAATTAQQQQQQQQLLLPPTFSSTPPPPVHVHTTRQHQIFVHIIGRIFS